MRFHENKTKGATAPLRVWQLPSTVEDYVIGADVAEGLEHGDASSAHVVCVQTGKVVAAWHGRTAADQFGHELVKLGRFYNTALIGCEANAHGLTTNTKMRDLRYPRIYRERRIDTISQKMGQRLGWYTTRVNKPQLIDNLNAALREGSIEVLDKDTIAELLTYVRDEKGRMGGSPHDDRVISLALAVQMLQYAHASDFSRPDERPRWSMSWWREQADKASKPKEVYLGGDLVTRS